MPKTLTDKSKLLTNLSPFIYGTTRLGDDKIPFDDRVKIARTAMEAGVWFHTSHTYDDALDVLGTAFNQDRTKIPKLIIKIGWDNMDEIRDTVHQNLEPLGLEKLDIGQLCLGDSLAEEFANGGACYKEFQKLKDEGLVERFVLEVFPWNSDTALKALRGGFPEGLIDGYILYLNPLQRFASNELWNLLNERNEPVVAMRTVSGGPVHRLRDVPGAAWKEYLQQRAVEVAPIFECSGIQSWTEFCIRFAHSMPQVRATVGSTGRVENLKEFFAAMKNIKQLPKDIVDDIVKLQYLWSDELDIHAKPWSM